MICNLEKCMMCCLIANLHPDILLSTLASGETVCSTALATLAVWSTPTSACRASCVRLCRRLTSARSRRFAYHPPWPVSEQRSALTTSLSNIFLFTTEIAIFLKWFAHFKNRRSHVEGLHGRSFLGLVHFDSDEARVGSPRPLNQFVSHTPRLIQYYC